MSTCTLLEFLSNTDDEQYSYLSAALSDYAIHKIVEFQIVTLLQQGRISLETAHTERPRQITAKTFGHLTYAPGRRIAAYTTYDHNVSVEQHHNTMTGVLPLYPNLPCISNLGGVRYDDKCIHEEFFLMESLNVVIHDDEVWMLAGRWGPRKRPENHNDTFHRRREAERLRNTQGQAVHCRECKPWQPTRLRDIKVEITTSPHQKDRSRTPPETEAERRARLHRRGGTPSHVGVPDRRTTRTPPIAQQHPSSSRNESSRARYQRERSGTPANEPSSSRRDEHQRQLRPRPKTPYQRGERRGPAGNTRAWFNRQKRQAEPQQEPDRCSLHGWATTEEDSPDREDRKNGW